MIDNNICTADDDFRFITESSFLVRIIDNDSYILGDYFRFIDRIICSSGIDIGADDSITEHQVYIIINHWDRSR